MDIENLPLGDKVIFALCELSALPYAFDAVERRRAGEPWLWNVLTSWAIALGLMLLGFLLPLLRNRLAPLAPQAVAALDRLIRNRRVWFIVAFAVGLYLALAGMLFLSQLRTDLDTYVMPRTVTSKQAARLQKYLSQRSPHTLWIVNVSDEEAAEYAGQLGAAFHKTKWDMPPVYLGIPKPELMDAITKNAVGLQIEFLKTGPAEPYDPRNPGLDELMRDALVFANIEIATVSKIPDSSTMGVVLIVGRRPFAIGLREHAPVLTRIGHWLANEN